MIIILIYLKHHRAVTSQARKFFCTLSGKPWACKCTFLSRKQKNMQFLNETVADNIVYTITTKGTYLLW